MLDLAVLAQTGIQRVSVVVPNYNYERYIRQRLQSIISQDYPVYEIIVLDDASTDKSVSVIKEILSLQTSDYQIICNKKNSGTVFNQWKKGIDRASGDYVWIAEADDFCSDEFLGEVMHGFESPDVVLSYCESNQVDSAGEKLADNYLEYVSDIDSERWLTSYVRQGKDEVIEALSVKNTIPNVSAVVFYRSALKVILDTYIDEICTYRVAGDWFVYVLMLHNGKISFSSQALNMHRRHTRGVTIGGMDKTQLNEISRIQAFVATEYDVTPEKSHAARKYINTLTEQFGILK